MKLLSRPRRAIQFGAVRPADSIIFAASLTNSLRLLIESLQLFFRPAKFQNEHNTSHSDRSISAETLKRISLPLEIFLASSNGMKYIFEEMILSRLFRLRKTQSYFMIACLIIVLFSLLQGLITSSEKSLHVRQAKSFLEGRLSIPPVS